jgi:methylmalonyl-CoA mutase
MRRTDDQRAAAAQRAHGLYLTLEQLGDQLLPAAFSPAAEEAANDGLDAIRVAYNRALADIGANGLAALRKWPQRREGISTAEFSYTVRDRELRGANYSESLSHNQIPMLAALRLDVCGEILRFLQNLPGAYPYRRCLSVPGEKRIRRACLRAKARRNTSPFPTSRGPRATRLSTAFVRPVVQRIPTCVRMLRAHRQFRRVDRDAR